MSFKPYTSKGSYRPDTVPELYDSDFEERFSRYLIQEMPAIESVAGDTCADKVQKFFDDNLVQFDQALVKTLKYIKTERITHFISGIDLGAAIYSISTSKDKLKSKNAEFEIGQEYLAGIGGGMKSEKEEQHRQKRKHSIGEMKLLKRGRGEGVIGYSIQPLFRLVSDEHVQIKKLLQKSIRFYLDRNRKSL